MPPILEYGGRKLKTGNCAIIGGPVYRGDEVPALYGRMLFGDFCSGRIWTLPLDASQPAAEEQLDTDLIITSFGVDEDGWPLVADFASGRIYRLVNASAD